MKAIRIFSGYKTQKKLAEITNISAATISRIESGIHLPTPDTLAVLSKYFLGVTYEELLVAAGYMDEVMMDILHINIVNGKSGGSEEAKMVKFFPDLPPEEKLFYYKTYAKSNSKDYESIPIDEFDQNKISSKLTLDIFDGFNYIKKPTEEAQKTITKIPLYKFVRQHHTNPNEKIGFLFIDNDLHNEDYSFALKVPSNSMSGDRIYKDDIVIVDTQLDVNEHDIVVVSTYDNLAALMRVKKVDSNYMLIPSNPSDTPILVNQKHVHIFGKVVEVRFWPK